MPNRYVKILLSVLAVTALSALKVNAQYYDSENEICFYVNSKNPAYCIVLNFDGDRATYFNHTYQFTVQSVQNKLNEDPNYFEKAVNRANYNMKYTSRFSGIAYYFQEIRNGFYGSYADSYVMEFSEDRYTLEYKCFPQESNPSSSKRPSKTESYKRVPKEFFVTQRIGRSSGRNNGIIYE